MTAFRNRSNPDIRRRPTARLSMCVLRIGRRAMAWSGAFALAGLALLFLPWGPAPVLGAICASVGLALFLTAGYSY